MHDGVNRLWILRVNRGLDLDGFPSELEAIDWLIRHMLVRSSDRAVVKHSVRSTVEHALRHLDEEDADTDDGACASET